MSGGGGSAAPAAPDPVATANAQAAANKEAVLESAKVNQINQVTPYGNMTYSGDIESPDRTVTQTLSAPQQQMLDESNQAGIKYGQTANDQLNAVAAKLAQPIDFSTLGAVPTADAAARTAAYNSILSRAQPQMDQDQSALETKLANQGIVIGSDAYKHAMADQSSRVNDFRLGADAQAGNEMAQQVGLQSTARNQAENDIIQQRQIPLNELSAMLTGTQVQAPSFVNTSNYQVQPADIAGATYGSANLNNQNYALGQQAKTANNQGMYGLAGAGLMAGAMFF